MRKTIKFSIAGIFILILGALAFYNNQKKDGDFNPKNIAKPQFSSLPEFSAVDIFGNTISTSYLIGKKLFILFIDPKSDSQIESLKRIYQKYINKKLEFIVFVKHSKENMFELFMDEMRFALGNITIITEKYEDYKKSFNAPLCCEKFYLFDKSGNLITSGLDWKLYTGETLQLFEELGRNKIFSISNFIKPGEKIKNFNWFAQLSKIIDQEQKYSYFIISMFNDICNTCLNGRIINNLKKSYELNNSSYYFLIVLSENFSDNDMINFKKILKIKIPVIRADENLSAKWNQLIEKFGSSKLNNLVFLIDNTGKIINLMNPRRQEEFFTYFYKKNPDEFD